MEIMYRPHDERVCKYSATALGWLGAGQTEPPKHAALVDLSGRRVPVALHVLQNIHASRVDDANFKIGPTFMSCPSDEGRGIVTWCR